MKENIQKPMLQTKERDYWFDNAKAFLIIFVVLAHLSEDLIVYTDFSTGDPLWLNTLYKSIYVFHMPVFLIVSGRFAKKRIDNNDWISVINKLVVPYIVLQTVMMFFYSFTGYASVSRFSYFSPLFGVWYIITIAVYQLITPHLKKLKGLFVIALIVAIVVQFGEAVPFGGFMRLFTHYPFFLLGYYTSGRDLKFCKKPWFRVLSVLAFIALFVSVWMLPEYFKVGALTLKRVYSGLTGYFYDLTQAEFLAFTLIHYLVGFAFFFFTLGISPTKKTFFSYIGTQSTYIYMLHLFFIIFSRSLAQRFDFLDIFNSDIKAAMYVFAGIPLAFLLASPPVRKAMRWLVAPKFDLKKLVKKITED
ncbi:MAG: hypothetical protein E7269_00850 [Lachnospiraceae bacterium]|nr:hypothetical protein [Lachnospiraceae bacterium]